MFGSVINHWSDEIGDIARHPHDFLDDLESFFWTYIWIIMVHNGPGAGAILAKSNAFISRWTVGVNNSGEFWSPKAQYLGQPFPPWYTALAPYFSHPPYTVLAQDLRSFFSGYYSGNGTERRTSEDLFPHMDDIYAKVLVYFDKAIEQLGGPPNITKGPPPTLIIATPMSGSQKAPSQPLRRIQPYRHGKRACEEDQPSDPCAKRQKVAHSESQLDTSKSDKISLSNSNRHRVVREGVRRSERIRERKKKGNSVVIAGRSKLEGLGRCKR